MYVSMNSKKVEFFVLSLLTRDRIIRVEKLIVVIDYNAHMRRFPFTFKV